MSSLVARLAQTPACKVWETLSGTSQPADQTQTSTPQLGYSGQSTPAIHRGQAAERAVSPEGAMRGVRSFPAIGGLQGRWLVADGPEFCFPNLGMFHRFW